MKKILFKILFGACFIAGSLLLGSTGWLQGNQYTVKFIDLILRATTQELATAKKLEDVAHFWVGVGTVNDWNRDTIDTETALDNIPDDELVAKTKTFAPIDGAKRIVLWRRTTQTAIEVIFGYDRIITDGLPFQFHAVKAVNFFSDNPKETDRGNATLVDFLTQKSNGGNNQSPLEIATVKAWEIANGTETSNILKAWTKDWEKKHKKTTEIEKTGDELYQLAQALYGMTK